MGNLMRDLNVHYQILDNSPISIVVKDYFHDGNGGFYGGKFVRVSKTKAKHHNLEIPEILGKTDFDLLPKEEAEKILADDIWVMTNKKPIENKLERVTHSNGEKVWKLTSKFPRYTQPNGKLVDGIISMSMEIPSEVIEQIRADLFAE